MIPVLISVGAAIISIVIAVIFMKVVTRKRKKEGKLTKKRQLFITCISAVIIYFGSAFVYFGIYSHAGEKALQYMQSDDAVKVSEVDTGYFFDGPGTENALIFYPGAKVDEKAYAQLMHELAADGTDCYLLSMPLHMAFMAPGKAGRVVDKGEYKNYYIAGHSLGGAMIAGYVADNADKLAGAIFLAAYSIRRLPDSLSVAVINASNDGVVEWDSIKKNEKNLPKDAMQVVIEGGNHSQFGDYGFQKGDNEATISADEQIRQTKETIDSLIKQAS